MCLHEILETIRNRFLACLGQHNRISENRLDPDVLDNISDGQDIETLRTLQEDLRHAHAETLSAFSDLSEKNSRLIQFTGTVFVVIAGSAALVEDNIGNYVNIQTKIGVSLLVISIILLIYFSGTSSVESGVDRDVFSHAVGATGSESLNERSYRIWICKKYTDWIDNAAKQNRTKACRLRIAETLTIIGLGFILAGIFIQIT